MEDSDRPSKRRSARSRARFAKRKHHEHAAAAAAADEELQAEGEGVSASDHSQAPLQQHDGVELLFLRDRLSVLHRTLIELQTQVHSLLLEIDDVVNQCRLILNGGD